MIDKNRIQSNCSSRVLDATIRRFLLGQLNATEQSIFEERLFTDDELEARVRLAEFDLTDDYAFERLSRADRERARQNFLLSADRNRMLLISGALRDRFASISEPHPTFTQRLRTLLDVGQPVWRYAFTALLLLLVFATVWRGIKEPRLVEQIIPKRIVPKPTATQTPQETHHPATSSSPVHVEQSPTMPAHEVFASTIALDPKRTRDNPTIVNQPQNNGVVRFQLLLENNQTGPYRAELLTANGESIFSADSLELDDGKINFDIPARVVKTSDYQVNLTRISNGSTENVASYYFRVQ